MSPQIAVGDEHINARVVENVAHLVGLEKIVDRHHHSPGLEDAKERWNELGTVLKPKPHSIACVNPELLLELVGDEDRLVP